jgi:hypothetical protein
MVKLQPARLLLCSSLLLTTGLMSACATDSPSPAAQSAAAAANTDLQFVDLASFDKDLSGSLAKPVPKVEVAFYDRVTPSALPDRMQKWMASVEDSGGSVKVVPPKSTVTAKNPFLLLSAVSAIYSANKLAHAASADALLHAARVYDAEILLKVDGRGDTVVDKIVFERRPAKP